MKLIQINFERMNSNIHKNVRLRMLKEQEGPHRNKRNNKRGAEHDLENILS